MIFLLTIIWDRRALALRRLFDGVGCEHINVGSGLRAILEHLFGFGKSLVLILLAPVHDAHDADGTDCNTNYHGYSQDTNEACDHRVKLNGILRLFLSCGLGLSFECIWLKFFLVIFENMIRPKCGLVNPSHIIVTVITRCDTILLLPDFLC